MSPALDEATLIRRAAAVAAVILVGLFFGYQASRGYVLPVALLAGFFLFALLLTRPKAFLLLSIFVFYGALGVVDMESFGRVAGLFRLKDVFTVLIVGYPVVTGVLQKEPRKTGIRFSRAYRPWAALLLWVVFVFGYTVVVIGERGLLAFRVGRTYLFYGMPFLMLWWLRNDKDWRQLDVFLHVLALATIGLAFLGSLGIRLRFLTVMDLPPGIGSAESLGLYRFGNPGESLVFAMFMVDFWRFCQKPTGRNGFAAAVMAFGSSLFLFRIRIAGTLLGIAFASLFVPARVRLRGAIVGLVGLVLLIGVTAAFGLLAKPLVEGYRTPYLSRVAGFFQEGIRGLTRGDTADVMGRAWHVRIRWPLVREHPILGIGFISPFGSIAWDVYTKGGMPIGVVDVGWIDILVRLGFGGAFFLSLLLVFAVLDAVDLLHKPDLSIEEMSFCLALAGFVVLMLVSLYSFSYPTWEPAIVTFSLLFSFVLHMRATRQASLRAEPSPLPPPLTKRI